MKALFYPEFDKLIVAEQPVPEISNDEVLLRVLACGICSSEIETFKKRSQRRIPPLIMGHEFCGEVVKKGRNVKSFQLGEKVVSNSVVSCRKCPACLRGATNLCTNRQVFGMHRYGAFAEYVNVPADCLIRMPPSLAPEIACLAEPLANSIHIINQTRSISPQKVLIIGAGTIGLLTQQAFQVLTGADVIVADLRNERLRVAGKNNALKTINVSESDLVSDICEITDGQGVDLVIDAVGMEETNQQALKVVRAGGTVVLIGLYENSRSLSTYDIILAEKHVTGTYAATDRDIEEAVALLASGKLDVVSWIRYYDLSDGISAFTDMLKAEGSHIKSIILYPQADGLTS